MILAGFITKTVNELLTCGQSSQVTTEVQNRDSVHWNHFTEFIDMESKDGLGFFQLVELKDS